MPSPADPDPDPGSARPDGGVRFEDVDWDAVRADVPAVSRWTLLSVAILALYVGVVAYDYFVVGPKGYIYKSIDVAPLDWLFVLSLLCFGLFVVVPLARRPRLVARYWKRFRTRRLAVASLAYLVALFVLGIAVPAIHGRVDLNPAVPYHPPPFFSVPTSFAFNCQGHMVDYRCYGSFAHPLGTAELGKDMVMLVIAGMRVAVRVATITSMLIIPIATITGTAAGYLGGRVDAVLTRLIDVVQMLPAFLVYVILAFVFTKSLFLIVLVFGLLNWGGVARLVRSETVKRREEDYVRSARNAGAGTSHMLRRHFAPNVANTVLASTTRQIPMIIIAEAALSLLHFGDVQYYSWGQTIGVALRHQHEIAMSGTKVLLWWIWGIPAVFIFLTAVAFAAFGDGLQHALDPREEV